MQVDVARAPRLDTIQFAPRWALAIVVTGLGSFTLVVLRDGECFHLLTAYAGTA